jgi:hypothetical protein
MQEGKLFHLWGKAYGPLRSRLHKQLVLPKSLRTVVLMACHDAVTSGHLGFEKTYDMVRCRFFWEGMCSDVKEYVASCHECQRHKSKAAPRVPQTRLVARRPFEMVGVDVLGPLTTSLLGNKYIVVFTDYLTRWVEAFAVATHTASKIAELIALEIFLDMGHPKCFCQTMAQNSGPP